MKLPANLDAVCIAATQTWGQQEQEAVAIGELGELLTLFGRRKQKRDSPEQWRDEICDGIIMMRQLAHIHNAVAMDEILEGNMTVIRYYKPEYAAQAAIETELLGAIGDLLVSFEDRYMRRASACFATWVRKIIRITSLLYALGKFYEGVEQRLQEKVDKLEARVAKYIPTSVVTDSKCPFAAGDKVKVFGRSKKQQQDKDVYNGQKLVVRDHSFYEPALGVWVVEVMDCNNAGRMCTIRADWIRKV